MTTFRTIAVTLAIAGALTFGPALKVRAESADIAGAQQAMTAGDYARATTLYTNVLQGEHLEPQQLAEVYYARGTAHQHLGSLTHAISDYTNAVWLGALTPKFEAKVFLARAIAQLESNQINRAETDFDSAIAKDGELADAYFGRATVRRLQAELDAAIEDYDKALALDHPSLVLCHYGRGLAYEALGETMDASRDFAQAAKLDERFVPARSKLTAMGLPIPAPDPAAQAALTPSPGPGMPISVASTPGLEVALGLAPDDDEATASLMSEDGGVSADGMMSVIAETGTSHAAPAETADNGEFLRPSAEGPLEVPGAAAAPAAPVEEKQIAALTPEETGALPGDIAETQAPLTGEAQLPETADLPKKAELFEKAPEDQVALAAPAPDAPAKVPEPAVAAPAAPSEPATPSEIAPVASAEAAAPATPIAPKGLYFVQVASFQQKALAEKGRLSFGQKFPEIAAQVPPTIVQADLGSRGTVYRLRLGPLDDAADSTALCASLKKEGQDCIIVPPAASAPAG